MFSRVVKFFLNPLSIQIVKPLRAQIPKYSICRTKNEPFNHITCTTTTGFYRYYCQNKIEEMIVDYEHVKRATSTEEVLIIDVREPDEIKEHGKIPNSINIPLGNVTTALGPMPDKDFQDTYQRPKPSEDTEMIFYCMIGKRSGMAQQNARNLGFRNVKNYLGSWTDWASKGK